MTALSLEVTGEGEVLIHGELIDTDNTCPKRGSEAHKPHQYYEKRVRHLPMMNLPDLSHFRISSVEPIR